MQMLVYNGYPLLIGSFFGDEHLYFINMVMSRSFTYGSLTDTLQLISK
jgi:hypothetical protein